MKLSIEGTESIAAPVEKLWTALNDPDVLTRCIPGCAAMTETGPDAFQVRLELKVASVGGSFEGAIALSDKQAPVACVISVSGSGTLGNGVGRAHFTLVAEGADDSRIDFAGEGEIGGLVAGVGQRILGGVSRHLIKRFFTALRKEERLQPAAV